MTVFSQIPKFFLLGMAIYWVLVGSLLGETQTRGRDPNSPEAISFVVSPYGFAQSSLYLHAGTYLFVVLNRTGFEDITVYLERMPGTSLTGAPARQEFGDSVGASRVRLLRGARLTPGTYRIRVENRPTWVCAIHVN